MAHDIGDKSGKSKTRLPWFKMYPEDWLEDTRDLSETARAHYMDCLCLIYKYDGPLRDNDAWIVHQLHTTPKKWKASRDALIACGKLVVTDAGLINPRAERELAERAAQRSKKTDIALSREKHKRENPEFPFGNNKGKAQLCLVSGTDTTTDGPQEGLHARARLDPDLRIQKEDRSFNPGGIDERQTRAAQVPRIVSEAALDKVRKLAPGWDRQFLLKKFYEWPESKTSETDVDTLFLRWVPRFTKGEAA